MILYAIKMKFDLQILIIVLNSFIFIMMYCVSVGLEPYFAFSVFMITF